jgi:uncharacterized membrane-anchored protein YitT (DUF2179 family)
MRDCTISPFGGTTPPQTHTLFEDAQAIATGALVVAFGITLLKHAGLLTGGTAGLAFLIHYATGWNFAIVFFVLNLPFYGLALRTLGQPFTLWRRPAYIRHQRGR